MKNRLHFIDWLRVLAVLLLFPFHTGRVFNAGDPFYVKSEHLSMAVTYLLAFIDTWHMPLLFALAGASAYLALGRRTGKQFAAERIKRLLVPLVFGILVIMPPQTWVGAQFNSGYTGSFLRYITSGAFLVFNIKDAGDYFGGIGIGHLWFILFLFVLSLLALPLFLRATRGEGASKAAGFSRLLARPWGWVAASFIVLLAEAFPEIAGKNLMYYGAFLVLGFFAVADTTLMDWAKQRAWPALAIGLALCVAWVSTWPLRDALPDPSVPLTAIVLLGSFGKLAMIVGLLGLGIRFLDRPSPALSYLSESSYPVYILHQTVIVVAAFYLVRLPVGGLTQWIVLFAVSVPLTFALYEVVRRANPLRLLFGMRAKQPRRVRSEA